MESSVRWAAVTAIAPVAWGTTYFVTRHYLPADYPLYGAAIRALPAGVILLLVARRRPRGLWWWKALLLGALNVGAFFTLVYLAAQTLPTSVASTIMATAPIALMLAAWLGQSERPRLAHLAGAVLGIAGVAALVLDGAVAVDPWGVLASVAAMLLSSVGAVLTRKWSAGIDVISVTAWQLVGGGLLMSAAAVLLEGRPPTMDGRSWAAFGYVSVVATAVAFVAWFAGLRRLAAGTVGLIGLLNPITGVVLGTIAGGETVAPRQIGGFALVLLVVLCGQSRRWPALSGSAGRHPDQEEGRGSAQRESQRLVEPDRAGVLGRGVQERGVTPLADAGRDRPDEPGRQALAAVGRVGADPADLGPAGRPQPLAGHGHQRTVVADPQVRTELDGARQKRAGAGAGHQVEHLGHVIRAEPQRLRIGGSDQSAVDELGTGDGGDDLPARRGSVHTRQWCHPARPDQRGDIGPGARVGRVGQRDER
jgi:probable blue pigment (indigoidine) exporter